MADLAKPWATNASRANSAAQASADLSTLVGCHHAVHQSHGQRLAGADGRPAHEVLGPGGPDQTWQPLRSAPAGQDAQLRLGETQLRVLGADAEVTCERQLETSPQRVAVDSGDGGSRDGGQGAQGTGEIRADGRGSEAVQLDDVRAGGEDPPAAPHHDGPRRIVTEAVATAKI